MSGDRGAQRIEKLARSGLDLVSLWREVTPLMTRAVPHFESPCFFTVDPDSLLPTSHFQEGLPEIPAEWLGREYVEGGDYNGMTEVLISPAGVGTLDAATGGRPELSRKYHEEMQPFGCEQELLVALRTRDGHNWGAVGLYRETGRPDFAAAELTLMRAVAPALAAGARHALLMGQASEPDLPDAPGLLVLDRSLNVEAASPTAARWLVELGGSVEDPPGVVLAMAGAALGGGSHPGPTRVGTQSGWLVLHSAPLAGGSDSPRASVIIEWATAPLLDPLLMAAHGLTKREREVTRHVLQGSSTSELATRLGIAEGTVQAHLRSVFDKTGVRSRRELVSQVFRRNYEPRVRDNEGRAATGAPARDGPKPG